jgi:hypothetical protein
MHGESAVLSAMVARKFEAHPRLSAFIRGPNVLCPHHAPP